MLLVNKFHYKKGGSETYYFTIGEALKARGHEVIYFSMKDKERNIPCKQDRFFVSHSSIQGGIISKLKMVLHVAYSKEAYAKMKALLKEERPDMVLLNLIHKQITLSIIDAVREFDPRLPIFWTMHDLIAICPSYTMLDGNGKICEKCLKGDFRPCIDNRCIKKSVLLSMLSKYEADYIHRRKWYDHIDLFICPSEFYYKKLKETKFTSSRIVRLRNPLPSSTKYELNDSHEGYLLYFGRLSREKGIGTLIEAVKRVGCRLVILGTGPMESELKEHAGSAENIEFKGFQSGHILEEFIKKSRCVVLPSEWYENGPYSAMEAMAWGKPLIVSDMGGLPELVEDGRNGYIYETSGGIDALVDCICKMIMLDDESYRTMCRDSLEKARNSFNIGIYMDEIEKYYEEYRQQSI